MNFFSKTRLVFWLMIFLVVINVSVLVTFLVLYSQNYSLTRPQYQGKAGMAIRNELSLSPSQNKKVDCILDDYRNSTDPVAINIRTNRARLLEELDKEKPDTNIINKYAEEICLSQKRMQMASVRQYMALKEICNPVQCQRLSSLYY